MTLTLRPRPPFRLDYTVWALCRRQRNLIDAGYSPVGLEKRINAPGNSHSGAADVSDVGDASRLTSSSGNRFSWFQFRGNIAALRRSGTTLSTCPFSDLVQNRCEKQPEEFMQAQPMTRAEYERELDAAIAGSFPASDPLPWTLGAPSWMDLEPAVPRTGTVAAVTEVIVRDGYRVGGVRLGSLGEAIALAAVVPIAILIAGVPVVALVHGVTSAIAWLSGSR